MLQKRLIGLVACVGLVGSMAVLWGGRYGNPSIPNLALFPDPSGAVQTFSRNGAIDLTGPFFQSLGTNGRACATCHQPSDGMTVSAAHVQARFDATLGMDPIFRPVDGSNCDHDIDVSSLQGRAGAYSLLRTRGLIRVGISVPAGADFDIDNVSNPYGCSETATLSLYRRPLPATNLKFLSMVMWDGRESSQSGLMADLAHQAMDATNGHAQASAPLTSEQQREIVAFESGLYTAQAFDSAAGMLHAYGAKGGPQPLAAQEHSIMAAEAAGWDPARTAIFSLYNRWGSMSDSAFQPSSGANASIARGQEVFNSKPFQIAAVAGLNGAMIGGAVQPASLTGTCSTCHDALNVGNLSVSAPMDIGVADPGSGAVSYLPVITVHSKTDPSQVIRTSDPGRALITGKFADMGKFKAPVLRGLAARAPYFHNGRADTLKDVVDFYQTRFGINYTAQEKADLIAFLCAL